jgi:hypothetical protein
MQRQNARLSPEEAQSITQLQKSAVESAKRTATAGLPCSMPRIIYERVSVARDHDLSPPPRPRCAGRSRPAARAEPGPVCLARRGIGAVDKSLGLSLGESVPCPDPLLPDAVDVGSMPAATARGGLSGSYRVEHNNCSLHAHLGSARCRRIDSAWADCHAVVPLPSRLRYGRRRRKRQPGGP